MRWRRLAHVAAIATVTGCYGDVVSLSNAPSGSEPVGPDAAPAASDVDVTCADGVPAAGDGHHLPGTACGSCHDGGTGPAFSVAGTLFGDAAGGAPVAGATIHLIDADGNETRVVTAANGNFWTAEPIAFPVTAYASSCPSAQLMPTLADSGDCNSCHPAGDSIFLP